MIFIVFKGPRIYIPPQAKIPKHQLWKRSVAEIFTLCAHNQKINKKWENAEHSLLGVCGEESGPGEVSPITLKS